MSTTERSPATRWLTGPWSDLLFGCGLIYLVPFAVLCADGPALRDALPLSLTPFLVLLTGVPHYGATLLRVYENRADRVRYAFFAIFTTLAIGAAFVAGLYQVAVGSWLLTIYLTWSPWHYSGQNYGIALMFLRRRSVEVSNVAKRLLHASFVLSFLLTVVMMHAVDPGITYAPGQYEGTVYRLLALDLPPAIVSVLIPSLTVAYLATSLGAVWLLWRSSSLRDIAPATALMASQALWFVVPALARRTATLQGLEPLSTDHTTYAFLWVATAHALQYLWITRYYARARGEAGLPWAGKALAAGAAIWIVPSLLFAPGVLGRLPYDAGLALLIAAVVNIHHFILDGAIWKLRDGPIARILLRGHLEPTTGATSGRWLSRTVWTAGALSVGLWCFATFEQAYGLEKALAAGDVGRLETAHRRLGFIGQESAKIHLAQAKLHQQRGDRARFAEHIEAASALHPGADTLFELAGIHHRARQGDAAITALERALALRPDSRKIRNRLAWLLVTYRKSDRSASERALRIASDIVTETGGANATYLHTHAMAQAANGDFASAIQTGQRALRVAESAGQDRLAALIRRYLERYREHETQRGR